MSKKYLDIFCREAEEHLASLQSGLLVLEKNPGRSELLQELLRNAHTLKGSARMVSLDDISAITHSMEELLKEMEQGSRAVDAAAVDHLLRGADAVALITAALFKGEEPKLDVGRFLAEYQRGELQAAVPAELQTPVAGEPEGTGGTVRAEVKTLDSLVSLLGELMINKKRLEVKLTRLKGIESLADRDTAAALSGFRRELEEDVLYLDYLNQELHEKAMGLRMLPLKTISDGFERLVRDLSQKLGKKVRLSMTGWSTQMDRVLLEELKPMLLHLLSNAVCHGIETPELRLAAGKDAVGTVSMTARQEGGSVTVEVRDDGQGMDPERIRRTALERGVIERREAESLSDEEILYLTLRPGFSTAETVTDLAGRGVGMDVVKKKVERVKGSLTLTSETGSHTLVSLQLPLTLSVLEALLVRSGGESYAVPMSYVQEIVKVREADLVDLEGREAVKVQGSAVPLHSLAALLGLPEAPAEPVGMSALVLKNFEQRVACLVEAQMESSVVVVKGLGRQFGSVRFVFGATILGDGNPALILNVPDLLAAGSAEAHPVPLRPRPLPPRPRRVLVVDDSITTRTMEKSILVTHGYQVETAVSGEDALAKAAEGFDLVITDLEMPGISGFDLTRRLRADGSYRETPIIVVSSLSSEADQLRALEAGAQAYIVKGKFDQEKLLQTVRVLIG